MIAAARQRSTTTIWSTVAARHFGEPGGQRAGRRRSTARAARRRVVHREATRAGASLPRRARHLAGRRATATPAYLLNTALGGGMSSRLFQEVREKRGHAYSVYSFLSSYPDAGYLGIYVGTSRRVGRARWSAIILAELRARDARRPSARRSWRA